MGKLGIVTVLYKSDKVLEDFFKSISIQTYKDYKLYLVDNSVNNDTNELIKSLVVKYPITDYVHIKNEKNVGIAEGNNIGMRMALDENCAHLCLSNNDIEFSKIDLFEKLLAHSQSSNPAVLTPKIYMEGDKQNQLLWYAGGKYLFFRGSVWHDGYEKQDIGQFDKMREVQFAPACFVVIPRAIIEEVGLMDEQYFVYVDDADYMLRVLKGGFKIIYLPEFSILHKVSSSTGGVFSSFGLYYNTRNRVYWVRKFFRGVSKYISLAYIPFQMVYHTLSLNQKGSLGIILKAYRDGYKMKVN